MSNQKDMQDWKQLLYDNYISSGQAGGNASIKKGLLRHITWELLTLPGRLLLTAETGATGHILSQNMLVTATAT